MRKKRLKILLTDDQLTCLIIKFNIFGYINEEDLLIDVWEFLNYLEINDIKVLIRIN